MPKAAKIFQMIARLTGLIQILMGIGLWMGHGLSLTNLHMAIGVVLVLSLWILAFFGARARVGGGLVALSWIWGAVTLVFGMTQARILPGAQHEVIRVLHLLIGLGAISFAECLGKRLKKSGGS